MEAINIYPELIKWKPNKQGLVPISIRFDYNHQRAANETINHRIKPSDWDNDEKKVKKSCVLAELLNQLIENRINKHKNYFLRRETFNLPTTRELIRKYVTAGSTLESFYDYAEEVIKTKKLKDGGLYTEDTMRRYRDELKRLMQFCPELPFSKLNLKFLKDYKAWLQKDYKKKDGKLLDQNTIWKTFSFMRMIYNEAINNNIILADDNPFKTFEVGSYSQHFEKIKYLEIHQVNAIENLLINKADNMGDLTVRIGWRFLSMCVSGLRISDAMLLNDMFFNDAGDLQLVPHKTRRHGNRAHIPIVSERQKRYLEKTIELTLPETNAKSFRTTFNIHLKVICALAGIPSFTSHSGRHTMGSLLVDAGIEKKAAMAMLGVKSESVIETYLHLKNSKLNLEAQKLKRIME